MYILLVLQGFDIKYNCDNFLANFWIYAGYKCFYSNDCLNLTKTWPKLLSMQSPTKMNDTCLIFGGKISKTTTLNTVPER